MNTRSLSLSLIALLAVLVGFTAPAALAQNPVQWMGNARQAVARSAEQILPMLVWVKDGNRDDDENDLEDAQEDCFRDRAVVDIIHKHFVPFRASRNSRFIEEAGKLGLPTGFGLYCAVVTSDGKVIEQMGPAEVAQPNLFAAKLKAAYAKFCDDVFEQQLRPVLEDLKSTKANARTAARVVWRLEITKADRAIIGLLSREDLTPSEKGRLYELIAALGTQACIQTLMDRANEPAASNALSKASPRALEWIMPQMPTPEGEVSAKQLAAYTAAAKICRTTAMGKDWWTQAKPDARQKELDRVNAKAVTVLEYWNEQQGTAP